MSKKEDQFQALSQAINDEIFDQRRHLLGRVLTIIDASFADAEQRKAVKDLVNNTFWQGSYWNAIREHLTMYAVSDGIEITQSTGELKPVSSLNY